jgi:hypothetical protein
MSNKLKAALLFGVGMTFVFATTSIIDIYQGEAETSDEIFRSFGAALLAGIATGVLTYFFIGNSFPDKFFGKKNDSF